jgi:hypothetical protein
MAPLTMLDGFSPRNEPLHPLTRAASKMVSVSSHPRVPSYAIGRDRGEEWPRVLRVSTAISNTPTRFHMAKPNKWKRKKGMDGETRKKLGKRCKRRTMHLTIN